MFSLFPKKPTGATATLKLSGLHCVSCSLNIDDALEDLPGVIAASTSYAQQRSVIIYNPALVNPSQFTKIIAELGYQVVSSNYETAPALEQTSR